MKFLWGAERIGARIGVSPRRAYYLLETGVIPGRKVGERWVSEEGALLGALTGEDNQLEKREEAAGLTQS